MIVFFFWRMRMSFWSRSSGRDFKLIRMRQQNNHLAHEIQTLFFLQPLFKPLLIKFILTTKPSDIQVARLRWLLGYEFLQNFPWVF
jgi:hypothetical protein